MPIFQLCDFLWTTWYTEHFTTCPFHSVLSVGLHVTWVACDCAPRCMVSNLCMYTHTSTQTLVQRGRLFHITESTKHLPLRLPRCPCPQEVHRTRKGLKGHVASKVDSVPAESGNRTSALKYQFLTVTFKDEQCRTWYSCRARRREGRQADLELTGPTPAARSRRTGSLAACCLFLGFPSKAF